MTSPFSFPFENHETNSAQSSWSVVMLLTISSLYHVAAFNTQTRDWLLKMERRSLEAREG